MRSGQTINEAQTLLYWREWNKARRVLRERMQPAEVAAQRHELHTKALGKNKSSKLFTNVDLDAVLKEFRAISNPAGFRAQIDLADQPAKRGRYKVRQLLAALGKDDGHAEDLIANRREGDALVTVHEEAAATLEAIGPEDLERLALDLKRECRVRWKRKGDLLTEIRLLRMDLDLDEQTARERAGAKLKLNPMPEFHALDYDQLLKVIAVMRSFVKVEVPF